MSTADMALLPERGILSVTGEDARHFLDNLITNDMDLLDTQPAMHAGLLTPQGKILFAFFVIRQDDGYLIETSAKAVPELVKRLTMYKLRAKVTITDISSSRAVAVAWNGEPPTDPHLVAFPDPRQSDLGWRLIMTPDLAGTLTSNKSLEPDRWHAHRIGLGVPEAEFDYPIGDTFPHEADFDLFNGVSFTKGCFVGQEVVARMQHKTVVRKRVVPVTGAHHLATGTPINVGAAEIGRIGSVAGSNALALLRLDRVAEAEEKG
ncbi:MAG: YgfZ/GcvT domain-containing protein, partial [Hyphomicrobiaceae bacterium]